MSAISVGTREDRGKAIASQSDQIKKSMVINLKLNLSQVTVTMMLKKLIME